MDIEPKLIDKRLLKKLFKKKYKNKNTGEKIFYNLQTFLIQNWYIVLIISFIIFILYLRRKEKFTNNQPIKKEKKVETLVNSNSFEKDYYSQIKRVGQLPIHNHPHLNNHAGVTPKI